MQRFQRFEADQRWDLPFYNSMKKFIEEEFQAYAKFFYSPDPRVVKNWLIENAGGLKVRVNQTVNSTLFATARVGKEDFHRHLTTDDVIDLTLSDNVVNFVEVQIFEKTCEDDTVAKWDTTASDEGEEFTQNVDLTLEQDFRLVSNTVAFSGDPDKLRLAEVTTSGGLITLITDKRQMLFDSGTFSFGSPRSDKGISNLKEMYDAITTILKEMKGGVPEWETEFLGDGATLLGLLERFSYSLVDGGDIQWENPTSDELEWSSDLRIIVPNRAFDYTVSAQIVSILSDQVAFVTLPDVGSAPGGPLAVSVVSNASFLLNETNARNYVLGYRSTNGKLYFGNGWNGVELESGEKTQLGDGITDALLTATGLTDENDATPPYTSTLIIAVNDSFTTAISKLDAALADTPFIVDSFNNGDSPVTGLASHEVVLFDAAAGNIIYNMITAIGNEGKHFIFKKIDSSTNTVTINTFGGQTWDGFTSRVLIVENQVIQAVSDDVGWEDPINPLNTGGLNSVETAALNSGQETSTSFAQVGADLDLTTVRSRPVVVGLKYKFSTGTPFGDHALIFVRNTGSAANIGAFLEIQRNGTPIEKERFFHAGSTVTGRQHTWVPTRVHTDFGAISGLNTYTVHIRTQSGGTESITLVNVALYAYEMP